MTLIRASGLLHQGVVDSTWETYWSFLATEVGIILVSLAAFRAVFVAHAASPPAGAWAAGIRSWYHSRRRLLRTPRRARPWDGRPGDSSSDGSSGVASDGSGRFVGAVKIPRAQITGLGTYINGVGRTVESRGDSYEESWLSGPTSPLEKAGSVV